LLPTLKNALNYSRLETSYSPGYFLGNYWYAFMVTMAMFNGRISEVLPLTFNDYSTKLHCFYVNKTTDIKTNITTESTKNVSSEDVVYCGEMFTNKVFLPWKKEMENWKYKNHKQLLFPSREGTTKQHGRVLKSVKKIFKDWHETELEIFFEDYSNLFKIESVQSDIKCTIEVSDYVKLKKYLIAC